MRHDTSISVSGPGERSLQQVLQLLSRRGRSREGTRLRRRSRLPSCRSRARIAWSCCTSRGEVKEPRSVEDRGRHQGRRLEPANQCKPRKPCRQNHLWSLFPRGHQGRGRKPPARGTLARPARLALQLRWRSRHAADVSRHVDDSAELRSDVAGDRPQGRLGAEKREELRLALGSSARPR